MIKTGLDYLQVAQKPQDNLENILSLLFKS